MELMVTTDLVDNGKKENTIDVYGAHQLFCNWHSSKYILLWFL